jgi:hypothetical protein
VAARRVNLPSADDLFRQTGAGKGSGKGRESGKPVRAVPDAGEEAAAEPAKKAAAKRPSGRVRHDEKMTVYVTADELLDLEHARLTLRSKHGVALDRGRLVREAVAIVLADLESNGEQSALVRRLATGE